jgi:hypothetical protein
MGASSMLFHHIHAEICQLDNPKRCSYSEHASTIQMSSLQLKNCLLQSAKRIHWHSALETLQLSTCLSENVNVIAE